MQRSPSSLSQALATAAGLNLPVVWVGETQQEALAVHGHDDGEQVWLVAFRLTASGDALGEWRLVEFAVRQAVESGTPAMSSKTIRSLPIGELLAASRKALSAQLAGPTGSTGLRLVNPSAVYLAPFLEDARGRRSRDDTDYAGLALEYAFLVQDGDRSPAKTLATKHGGASGTWANRIAEARRRGLLTPVKSGEAGGGVTDKAMKLINPKWSPEDDALIDAQIAEMEGDA
ncbi:hypothetical protein GCM10010172_09360 [Paractinoplanes ferrugineus]|uniref:Uncharacterized protein n=1 Tax=Paractinoplanes ferrugineus TaxID=113564 RepID=A0A919J2S4_9ACTN|nr:hypothetical protein [Actinoplanes ferrugineus]GIE09501.1 hypothetical protein Afe05nite_13410 [Actinoplanes ferrugineus]